MTHKITTPVSNVDFDVVYIDEASKLPEPVMGSHPLENGKHYHFTRDVSSPNNLLVPSGGVVRITSNNSNRFFTCTSGTKACIEAVNPNMIEVWDIGLKSPNFQMLNITGLTDPDKSFVFFRLYAFQDCDDLGIVSDIPFFSAFSTYINIGQGLSLVDNLTWFINAVNISGGKNIIGNRYFDISGPNNVVGQFSGAITVLESNERMFFMNPNLGTQTAVFSNIDVPQLLGGDFFAAGSLDQTHKFFNFSNCPTISDSTTQAELFLNGNASTTTTISDTPVPVVGISDIDIVPERIVFQEEVAFDNLTNTMTANFNHGLTDGDAITFISVTSLPAEINAGQQYFVINAAGTDFQVEVTLGGGVLNFTDNGTGQGYYRQNTSAVTEMGWMINDGINPVTLQMSNISSISASGNRNIRCVVMKSIATSPFTFSRESNGSVAGILAGVAAVSAATKLINLQPGQGTAMFIEELAGSGTVTVTDSQTTAIKS